MQLSGNSKVIVLGTVQRGVVWNVEVRLAGVVALAFIVAIMRGPSSVGIEANMSLVSEAVPFFWDPSRYTIGSDPPPLLQVW